MVSEPTALGAITCRTPSERSAHMFARYGMRCGGNRWSRPCRGRNATRRPATSPTLTGSLGGPKGGCTATSSGGGEDLVEAGSPDDADQAGVAAVSHRPQEPEPEPALAGAFVSPDFFLPS